MRPNDKYTYENAGFNGFMLRSLKSNPGAVNVQGGISTGSGKPVNVDLQSMFGSLGNKITMGRLILDGVNGRVIPLDENGEETGWIGNIET